MWYGIYMYGVLRYKRVVNFVAFTSQLYQFYNEKLKDIKWDINFKLQSNSQILINTGDILTCICFF